MADICQQCTIRIATNQHKITCSACAKKFHASCVNLTQNEIQFMKEKKEKWWCQACIKQARKSRSASETSFSALDTSEIRSDETDAPTLSQILKELIAIKNAQNEFSKAMDYCHDRFDEINSQLQKQEGIMKEYIEKMQTLEASNKILQKENEELKIKINDLEQYSRKNCLEIQGVPEGSGENVLSVVQAVGKSIGFELENHMVDACHRLRKNETRPSQARGVIIRFVRRIDKEEFLQKKKIKRELKVTDLPEEFIKLVKADNFIYVNESLTAANRKLFAQAREFKIKNKIKYLWTKDGKIMMRATDSSRVYQIRTVNDFNDVH